MKSKYVSSALLLTTLLSVMLIGIYCNKESTVSKIDTAFALISYSDCKVFAAKGNIPGIPEETCLEYSYDGSGTLLLKHINARFNCCLDSISASCIREDHKITINEAEHLEDMGCHCLCYYDLDFRLDFVQAGIYDVEITPSDDPNDLPMIFRIDITEAVTDTVCNALNTIIE